MLKQVLKITAKVCVSYFAAFLLLLHYWIFFKLFKVGDDALKRSRLQRGFQKNIERMIGFACLPFEEKPIVKIVTELNDSLLNDFINDRFAAIHIKGFLNTEENQFFLDKIAGQQSQNSLIANGVKTDTDNIGYTEQVLQILDLYYGEQELEQALKRNMELRELLSNGNYFSPIAKLTWKLNEMHPNGARKLNSRYSRRFSWYQSLGYSIRIYHDKSEDDFAKQASRKFRGFIHRDAPSEAERKSKQLVGFAANIYHQISCGGELYIWSTMSRTKIQKACNFLVQNLSQERLYNFVSQCCPEPEIISPEPGDLVLLNFSHMHAVNPSRGDQRITSQSLIYITKNGMIY
tara:strand:- start:4564 stop:5607 length:1044 start_codon:yes stop_codon:yes gene_type:complete